MIDRYAPLTGAFAFRGGIALPPRAEFRTRRKLSVPRRPDASTVPTQQGPPINPEKLRGSTHDHQFRCSCHGTPPSLAAHHALALGQAVDCALIPTADVLAVLSGDEVRIEPRGARRDRAVNRGRGRWLEAARVAVRTVQHDARAVGARVVVVLPVLRDHLAVAAAVGSRAARLIRVAKLAVEGRAALIGLRVDAAAAILFGHGAAAGAPAAGTVRLTGRVALWIPDERAGRADVVHVIRSKNDALGLRHDRLLRFKLMGLS